ncbi:hypothetical protein SDC9_83740 [bioreactor metagenome]|uniref:Uncharacterized protein n=1 Tax=bioreactor metagenome TaxID=1076179 RepID=A0A644ZH28_9ZZZZ
MRSDRVDALRIHNAIGIQPQFGVDGFLGAHHVTHRHAQLVYQCPELLGTQGLCDVVHDLRLDAVLAQNGQRAARIAAAGVVVDGEAVGGTVCVGSHAGECTHGKEAPWRGARKVFTFSGFAQCVHAGVQVLPPRAAVLLAGGFRLAVVHHRHQRPRHQRAPDRTQQSLVADIAGRIAGLAACAIHEAQAHRLHRRIRGDGSLQQIGMERQQLAPVAGRALGEHGQHLAPLQGLVHALHHAQRVAPRTALDIERARCRRQRADDGPVAHVGLGDEAAIARRMQHGDVQPGDVIGHHQHRPTHYGRAANLKPDARACHELQCPGLHTRLLLLGRQARKAQQHDQQSMQRMNHQSHDPPDGHGPSRHRRLALLAIRTTGQTQPHSKATWPPTSV